MIRRLKPRPRSSDSGAILIFALLIVTTIALVIGVVLTRGDGSLRATVALRTVAGTSYSADSAANIALNDLREGANIGTWTAPSGWAYANDPFDGCFGRNNVGVAGDTSPVTGLTLSNFYPPTGTQTSATSAYVDCQPENGTGVQGTPVAITDLNKPGNAILTLGTSTGEHGFTFKTNGSGGAFRVKGGVWSSSDIYRDTNGQLEATQYIKASTGCTPLSAMTSPTIACTGTTSPGDPNYQNDLDAATPTPLGIPTLQSAPATCPGGAVTLNAGYYDDVTNLNNLTRNGGSACFIHFNPGTYYFDFHNNSADPLFQSAIAPSSADVWSINNGVLVGGTLTSGTTIPGRCVSPIDSTSANGVQFIFGGDSRIALDHGAQMEICASYRTGRPPIAFYGQKTGANPGLTIPPAISISSVSPTPVSSPIGAWIHGTTGSLPAQVGDITTYADGSVATFKRSGGTSTATLTASGFTPPSAIPKGAILTGASVKVGYSEVASSAASLTITPSATLCGSPPCPGTPLTGFSLPGTTPTPQPYAEDLSSGTDWGKLQKFVHDNGLATTSIGFAATPSHNGDTTTLDSLNSLTLQYYIPQVRGETTTTIPSNTVATVGGSPVISAQGNTTLFYTQGTTYAPNASLSLALNNISESVFRFGVIARSLNVFETGSFSYPGAVIELPDNSPGWGTKSTFVQLVVYLCPGSSTCSPSTGTKALLVRAQLWDPSGTTSPPGRQVTVLSWNHTN